MDKEGKVSISAVEAWATRDMLTFLESKKIFSTQDLYIWYTYSL